MPLFARPHTGEGVYVEPAARRPFRLTPKRSKVLRQFRVWWDYHRRGLSMRDVAELVDRPLSSVQRGISTFADHLERLRERRVPARIESPLVPAFGCRPYTPDRADRPFDDCPDCRNHVASDAMVCPFCWRVSEANEDILDARRDRDERREARVARNRRITGEPPAELVARWDEVEKAQAAELAAELAARDTPATTPRKTA